MKVIAIIKYLFTLIGIAMLVGAFFLYRNTTAFLAEAAKADGLVVDLVRSQSSDSTTYRPVVRFMSSSGEEIEFVSSTGSNPPSYSRGEKVEVLYLPAKPEKARINGFFSLWGATVILGVLGGVFSSVGIGIFLAGALTGRRDEYLRKHGTAIETQFQGVERNEAVTVNGRHPFRVATQWQNPATSEVHVFHSNNLWFDPSSYITDHPITVFIERNNPKKYYVDLSFLPKLAD